jgi:5-methylthioadenosine/S-adenosylhomocysteine deaminase
MDRPWTTPQHSALSNIVYSLQGSDVALTMVDGEVLYENGEYLSIDIEKAIYNAKKSAETILGKLKE